MIASIDLQTLLRLRLYPTRGRGHPLLSFKREHAMAESCGFADNCNSGSHVLIFCQGFSVLFSSTVLCPSYLIFAWVCMCLGRQCQSDVMILVMYESMLLLDFAEHGVDTTKTYIAKA